MGYNTATTSLTITNLDSAEPKELSLTAANLSTTTGKVVLTGTAKDSDSVGIQGWQITTDGEKTFDSDGWNPVSSKAEISQTFDTINKGTYYFYVKDKVGVSKTSVVVDDTHFEPMKPTVTSDNENLTNKEVTITVGNNKVPGVKYTYTTDNGSKWNDLNSENSFKITTDGDYTNKIKVRASLGNAIQDSNTTTAKYVKIIPSTYYGDAINYSVNGVSNWKIFYADEDYVYIITTEAIKSPPSGLTGTNYINYSFNPKPTTRISSLPNYNSSIILHRYFTSNSNIINGTYGSALLTSGLVDSRIWNTYVNSTYAEECIGGPTIELVVKCWNSLNSSTPLSTPTIGSDGYTVNGTVGYNDIPSTKIGAFLTVNSTVIDNNRIIIASPPQGKPNGDYNMSWSVNQNGNNYNFSLQTADSVTGYTTNFDDGLRPLVRLKSDIRLTKSGNWNISK